MDTLFTLPSPEPDLLYKVFAAYSKDTRSNKVDLGVGVYCDEHGHSTVMESTKSAEREITQSEQSKRYLPLRGRDDFLNGMSALLDTHSYGQRLAKIQTVGGTGGVRLALELAKKNNPNLTVFVGTPTWPNHLAIPKALGIEVKTFVYYDNTGRFASADNTDHAIGCGKPGDIIIFHGPCHNPTGAELSAHDYRRLICSAAEKGMIPLIDTAYYGLSKPLENDMQTLSNIVNDIPYAYVVMSCSKSFSLYRERTGILFATAPNAEIKARLQANLEIITRQTCSMAPSHGAAIVGTILNDNRLKTSWLCELEQMRKRIKQVRQTLYNRSNGLDAFRHLPEHAGIFTLLPLSEKQVTQLADDFAFYIVPTGRVNLAGLSDLDVLRFSDAMTSLCSTNNAAQS